MATCLPTVTYTGQVPVAGGDRAVCPWGIYTLQDGTVLVQCTEDGQWQALVAMLGDPDWGTSRCSTPRRGVRAGRRGRGARRRGRGRVHGRGVPDPPTPPACRRGGSTRPRRCWPGSSCARGVRSASLDSRRASPPRRRRRRCASAAWRRRAAASPSRAAPSTTVASTGRRAPPMPGRSPATAPLAGLRVIDMTWVWAGPFSAMQLAQLGAEVIKIESRSRIDVTRRLGPFVDEAAGHRPIRLLQPVQPGQAEHLPRPDHHRGRAVLGRLLAQADVVVDNMRAGALGRMGFDDARLRQLNPAIVGDVDDRVRRVRPRARPAGLRLADRRAGRRHRGDRPVGGGPTEVPMSLPDPCAGLHAAIGTLGALYRRAPPASAATWSARCSRRGSPPCRGACWRQRRGPTARRPGPATTSCPHGAFPCAGEYAWVAIAVDGDDEFAALARASVVRSSPPTSGSPRWPSAGHEAELEEIVPAGRRPGPRRRLAALGRPASRRRRCGRWTRSWRASTCRARLLHHARAPGGRRPAARRSAMAAVALADAGRRARRRCLGQHTAQVMRDVLGLTTTRSPTSPPAASSPDGRRRNGASSRRDGRAT